MNLIQLLKSGLILMMFNNLIQGGFFMDNIKIEAGATAPNFNLAGSDDKFHRLKDYRGKKLVLYFYPKDSTSG